MRKIIKIRKFNPARFSRQAIDFLRRLMEKTGRQKIIIGLSGGVDSAVAVTLAVKSLGRQNVIAARLPSITSSQASLEDAASIAKFLKLPTKNFLTIPISSMLKVFQETVGAANPLNLGNAAARARMMILFDLSSKYRGLVLGTENKTENCMGYFTRFGDAASDIELIDTLYKTEVWQLASYLKIPAKIVDKAPTADLWSGQSDEREMGALYSEIDGVLNYLEFSPRASLKKISRLTGVSLNKVERIIQWLKKMQFKHKTPYVFKNIDRK